jgi:hypothetical protein
MSLFNPAATGYSHTAIRISRPSVQNAKAMDSRVASTGNQVPSPSACQRKLRIFVTPFPFRSISDMEEAVKRRVDTAPQKEREKKSIWLRRQSPEIDPAQNYRGIISLGPQTDRKREQERNAGKKKTSPCNETPSEKPDLPNTI